MEEILIPFFVCVLLPVSIVLIISLRKRNSDNKRAEVLIRAIESGKDVDTNLLMESFRNPKDRLLSQKEILYARLQRGCIFALVGAALLIVNMTEACKYDYDLNSIVLIGGGVFLAVGVAYLIVYFVTRNDVLNEK